MTGRLLVCCLLLGHALGAAAPACRSAPEGGKLVLLELYTSEGCDSCPAADRAFASLKADGNLAPLAWHVDYFDSLGWVDRFSLPQSARRQRELLAAGRHKVLATPQVFADGDLVEDWRDPRALRQAVARRGVGVPEAVLALRDVAREGGSLRFEVTVEKLPARGATLRAVVVQGPLRSQVTQGENKGLLLMHHHVVRDLLGPAPVSAAPSRVRGSFELAAASGADTDAGVVAWLQDGEGRILNATWASCGL